MSFYCVYYLSTGEAYSFGTVLSDDLPADFGVVELSEADYQGLFDFTCQWNPQTLQVDPVPIGE